MSQNLAISNDTFKVDVLDSEQPVLVDFTATWCGPCKMIGPFVEQLAVEYAGKARVFKIDIDENPEIASEYGIQSIPALYIFKGGKVVDKHVGAAPKPVLAALIDRHL